MTVKGPLSPDLLGITLPHEHIFIDRGNMIVEPRETAERVLRELPISIDILGTLRRNPFINIDNLVLDDIDLAIFEINKYKAKGGISLVEVTPPGMGRNPPSLRTISESTGINIICGTGSFNEHRPCLSNREKVEDLSERMVLELEEGIGESKIRAGIIGEIILNFPIHPNEKKVLKAAVEAQKNTGAALVVHPPLIDIKKEVMVREGHNVIDMLEEFGADLKKIILAHTDGVLNIDYHKSLLDREIIIEYDGLGFEIYHDNLFVGCWGLSDGPKIDVLAELCHQGYERQLLMSQDVCLKIMLSRYGGYGYAHILEHIVPMLRRLDVTKKQIKTMMVDNPQRVLLF